MAETRLGERVEREEQPTAWEYVSDWPPAGPAPRASKQPPREREDLARGDDGVLVPRVLVAHVH